jgi:hypothetical protein
MDTRLLHFNNIIDLINSMNHFYVRDLLIFMRVACTDRYDTEIIDKLIALEQRERKRLEGNNTETRKWRIEK